MSLWKTSLFLILGIASGVSAGKWVKEPHFTSTKISQLIRQGFTLSCQDCSALQYFLPGAPEDAITVPCPQGEVCGPLDGAFSCIEADDPDAAVCSCGDIETGYIQDPYDPMKYYACLPGGDQVAQECEDGEFYTGDHTDETTACETTPTCDANNVGFNKFGTSCTQYYFCEDAGATTTVHTCEAGKIWDNSNVGCVDPCSLAPAAFTCDGKDPSAYPDTTDCGVFHLCFAGQQFTQQCTDETNKYVNEDGMCVDDPKDCPTVDACYEEYKDTCSITPSPTSTTTTTTTQATTTETTTEKTSTERTHKTTTTTPSSTTDTTGRSTTSTTLETTQTTTDETTTDETTSTTEPSTTTTTELADVCDAETGICDCSKVTSAAYFPHNETCSKFYSCESDDNGGFEQKEYSCPGDLVFDPVNQYCNLLNLVPSCQNP